MRIDKLAGRLAGALVMLVCLFVLGAPAAAQDTTPPSCTVAELAATQGETAFSVHWSAADEAGGSGLSGLYRVQVQDAAVGAWTDWLVNAGQVSGSFSGLDGHTYYFQCAAQDTAGNWTTLAAAGFGDTSTIIKATNLTIQNVNDGAGADSDFTSSATTLSGNWSTASGAVGYSYAVGTAPGEANIQGWTDTPSTSFSNAGLTVVHGTVYYVSVRAKTAIGYYSDPFISDGILADQTAPAAPSVSADAQIQSTTQIQASWSATDAESGITLYEVSVGTTAGGADVSAWASAGQSTVYTITGLTLATGGTYFVNVRATNGAGAVSTAGSSSAITVSGAIPAAPASVNDGTGADVDYTSSTTQLSGNWSAVAGATSYEYAIGTTPHGIDIVNWTSAGANTSITATGLTLAEGSTYYLSARAMNGATPGPAISSDGATVDTSAPSTPVVETPELLSSNSTFLDATWIAEEPESAITLYEYAVGTTAATQDALAWTSAGTGTSATISNISMKVGQSYYIQVRATNGAGLVSGVGVSNAVIRTHSAGVAVTHTPSSVTAAQNANGTAAALVTMHFSESNGASVDYHQLQITYVLDNGTEFEDPIRAFAGFAAAQDGPVIVSQDAGMSLPHAASISAGGSLSLDFDVTIPEHVVTHSLGGRADAAVTMRLVFIGTDGSHQQVTTTVDVPVDLTSHAAAASHLIVGGVAVTAPAANGTVTNPNEFVARATVRTTGSGTLKGYWEIDGRPHHEFQEHVASGQNLDLSVKLPASLGGQHSIQVKIIMPQVKESESVSFTVQDKIDAAAFAEFWAGDLHFTEVRAVFDEDLQAYSGSAKLEYGIVKLDVEVPFSNLIIEDKNGRYELTGGAIKTEIDFSTTQGALSINMDRLAVTLDGAQVDGRIHFEGADGLPGIGPLHFYGVNISADGLTGSVSFPEPQQGAIGMFTLAINAIHFTYNSSGLALDALASLTFGDDAAGGALDCVFSMSSSGSAVFRVGEQAYEKAGVAESASGLSNTIGLAGFSYHVSYGELSEQDGALAMSATGGALDMASALGADVKLNVGTLKMLDTGAVTLHDISSPEFALGPFTAKVAAQEITLKMGEAPDLVMDFEVTAPLGGQKIVLTADNVPVNKDGLRDADIAIKPAQGSDHIAEIKLLDWADFKVMSATMHVKNRKPAGMTLAASMTFDGKGFESDNITWDNGDWSGTLKPVGDPSVDLAGVKMDFPAGSEIDLSMKGSGKGAHSVAVAFKNVSFDFSGLVGKPFKITLDELSYADGALSADVSVQDTISLAGLAMDVNKLHIESPNPAGGKREVDALFGGTLSLNVGQEIKIGFDNMKVSSTGAFGGDISPGQATEFHLFGASFQISKIHLSKPQGGQMAFTMDGSIGFLDSRVDFTGMTFHDGKLNMHAEVSESNPLRMPGLHFIGVTKLDIVDNAMQADGFLDFPAPISKRVPLDNLAIDTSGGLPDKIEISNLSFNVDKFTVNVTKASFDFKTKALTLDGGIQLPDGYFDQMIPFTNVSLGMPEDNSGRPAQADTSQAGTTATQLHDQKHNLPLQISSFSIGIDPSHASKWFINMSGKLTVAVEGEGFHLDFQNYKIYSDMSMSLGKVSGGVEIAGFGVDVADLEIVDNVSDPFTQISGGLHMESLGTLDVKDLRIHKSGAVELAGVHLAMDYNAYKYDVSISYLDKTFKGDGKITFEGKELDVDALFGPAEWMLDIQAKGLDIELFPGVTLDKLGGGVHYWKNNNLLKFKIDCGLALPEKDVLYGDVELDVATNGIVDISGDLKMFGAMPLGDAKIHIDIPNKTLAGTLHLQENVGIVNANVTLDALYSPSTWYLQGNGNANVLGKFSIGSVGFRLDGSGFQASGHSNINIVVADAGFDFSVLVTSAGSVSGSFHGHADATLIGIIHVSGDLAASYANGTFDGSLGLSGCLSVCLPGCYWHWVTHCCCGFNYPCGCSWHWWGLRCGSCHTQICVPLYQPDNCSWCYSKINKCAGITIHMRIDGNGVHVNL